MAFVRALSHLELDRVPGFVAIVIAILGIVEQ